MFDLFRLWFGAVLRIFRDRRSLLLENLTLRQQLAVLKRKNPKPRLGPLDKLFWVVVRRLWSQWKEALFLVQPETAVRWHRAGFKLYWAMLCGVRKRVGGGRRISKQIRGLIFQMVAENPSWGAPRIHGELLMLGFEVSETTISRWMRRAPKSPQPAKRWPFCTITVRRLPRWTSSRYRRSPSMYSTAFSSSATIGGASCTSMSVGIPQAVGLFSSYERLFLRCCPRVPGVRSRREVRIRSAQRYSLAEDHTCAHLDWKPLAEWSG